MNKDKILDDIDSLVYLIQIEESKHLKSGNLVDANIDAGKLIMLGKLKDNIERGEYD